MSVSRPHMYLANPVSVFDFRRTFDYDYAKVHADGLESVRLYALAMEERVKVLEGMLRAGELREAEARSKALGAETERATIPVQPQDDPLFAQPCRKCTAYPRIVVDRTSRSFSATVHCFSFPPCRGKMCEAISLAGCNSLERVISHAVARWNAEIDTPSNTNEQA